MINLAEKLNNTAFSMKNKDSLYYSLKKELSLFLTPTLNEYLLDNCHRNFYSVFGSNIRELIKDDLINN